MLKLIMTIGIIFSLIVSANILRAQDLTNVNVNKLSDQQIQQIVNEINARGLTVDEAARLAQMKGASSTQIEQMKRRIQELNMSKGRSNTSSLGPNLQRNIGKENYTENYSAKAIINASPEIKKIFGFQLFNSDYLTFEPSVNIPTPESYVIGIQDELTIFIWGASEQTYQLVVESNGAINIPELGPIYVSGMEFNKARELIKKRLVAIYHGMGGANPNTYVQVTLSNLRSIKVNVIGEAMVPGTYTIPATASAFNALYLSGGPNENGSFRNIQIFRDNKVIKTIDVYDFLINGNTQENIQLREQDVIYIPTYKKRVEVQGAFKRAGIFELVEKDRLADLIRYAGGFKEDAFQNQLSLTRITDFERKIIDISKSDYDNFILNNGDVVVASKIIDRFENRVSISGAVFRPGTYELTDGLTLSGLIKKAQGVKEDYFSNRGLILRLQNNLTPMTVSFNVDEVLKGTKDIQLQREDQVVIQDISSMREKRTVRILGEVQKNGEFPFKEKMTLKDLIFQAGGFTEAASESFVELARRHNYSEANQITNELVKLYQFTIDRQLQLDDRADTFLLKPFDYIYVRKAPSYYHQRTVIISGEVKYPGPYSIGSKDERVSELIARAGGLTSNAFVKGAKMKRIIYQQSDSLRIIRKDLADTLKRRMEYNKGDQLELKLEDILNNPGTAYDYVLKDGDQIIIPEVAQEVRIAGGILNPIGMAYQQGKRLKYYVNRSGGFSSKAQRRKTFVIYGDGTSRITRSFLWHNYPAIEPGCQIVIPEKQEKQLADQTGRWLGIASTMATLAIAISTLLK